jgi:hypothetical protein
MIRKVLLGIKATYNKRAGNEFLIGPSMAQQAEYWRKKEEEEQ